jgi:hypothetical protein
MFKKFYWIFIALIFIPGTLRAQQFVESYDNTPNLERHQLTFNLINPGIRYELGIAKNLSLSSSFNTALAYYSEGYIFGFAWHTQIRFYHNFKKRYDAEKMVMGNSANFASFARTVFFQPVQIASDLDFDKNGSVIFYGPTYGLQRTTKNNLNLTAEIGYGWYDAYGVFNADDDFASGSGFLLNITIGWVPTNRKSRRPIKFD